LVALLLGASGCGADVTITSAERPEPVVLAYVAPDALVLPTAAPPPARAPLSREDAISAFVAGLEASGYSAVEAACLVEAAGLADLEPGATPVTATTPELLDSCGIGPARLAEIGQLAAS
jgi:hypothetical protein